MDIRAFKRKDFPAVKAIYQQGIDTGNASFQTKAKSWRDWHSSMLVACRLVAEKDNQLVAWAGLLPTSSREVYAGVAEVSIYVANTAQGQGIGQKLLSALITETEQQGFWMLQAGIFPENTASVRLHKNNGFRILGTREKLGYMQGKWRDVVIMERRSKTVGA